MTHWPEPVQPRCATPRTPGRPLIAPGRLVLAIAGAFADHRSRTWPQPLMPHQRRAFATALQALPDGRPQFRTVIVMLPRQSGKSHIAKTLLTLTAMASERSRAWYTAQTRNDAKDYFLNELVASFDDDANPLREIARPRLTTGVEHIALPGRSTIGLFAPSRKALHGKQSDTTIIDEAWAVTEERGKELLQAIIPTGNTRPRFQLWILSTAGTDSSGFLKPMLEAARDLAMDPDGATCLIEYAADADETADDDTLIKQIAAAHPALGWTTDHRILADNLDKMGRAEFLRAFGNIWTSAADRVIPIQQWRDAQHQAPPPAPGPPAVLAVDVAPDRGRTAIACAWRIDGRIHAAVVAHDSGTDWAVAETARTAKRLNAPVVIDDGSPAGTLIDPLRRASVRVRTIGAKEVSRATGELFDEIMAGSLTLTPDPVLDVAAAGAAKRPLGDSWAWGRRASAVDISPLCAATWAAWGMRHPERTPIIV